MFGLIARTLRRIADRLAGPQVAPAGESQAAPVRSRYDAASTSDENRAHWSQADGYSANAAHTPTVRQILRNRSRYEAANNGYCRGLLRTRRNDVVGTGPRLQITLPGTFADPDFGTALSVPPGAASVVELKWWKWADATGLAAKLRMAVETGDRDGECFAVLTTNPALPDSGPQLDVRLYEADQVATPDLWWTDPLAVDGIRFDPHGNPVEYHFLKYHPGDLLAGTTAYDRVPAHAVVHWYDPERPNQARGVPSTTPSLNLYGQLRRYTQATLTAAEVSALITGVMKTNLPPQYDAPQPPGATVDRPSFDRVEFERGALLSLPAGWEASAFDAKQPVTGYGEFKREILTEAGAGMNAPRNVSTKSSAEYNYSSARLDHIPYRADTAITRDELRRRFLDRVFRAWLREAVLIEGYLPAGLPPAAQWTWDWQWDAMPSIDPVKDATADNIGLSNGTRTLSDVLAERSGKDWQEHLRQRAREVAEARRLEREHGLVPGTLYPLTPAEKVSPQPEDTDAEPVSAA
jgi:lambda family phage portal protein